MYRLYHLLFLVELNIFLIVAHLYALFTGQKNQKGSVRKILALPYYPLNYAGGHSRIGDWKPYFEKAGIQYDVHWASTSEAFLNELDKGSRLQNYLFYHQLMFRRFKVIFRLQQYDTIWIQRAFVPFYPFTDAYFEPILRKINNRIIVDYYDADYCSNYKLTLNTAKSAYKVTVAGPYLVNFFAEKGIKTSFVRFAMNYREYKLHGHKSDDKIVLGWMGSPANFKNVLDIENELLKIENQFPQIEFHFICREVPDLKLKRYKNYKWGDPGFDYHKAIANFDIGLAPMIHATERDKAKTAFKTLEYMASGLAFMTSPWGISDQLKDNENCLFANTKEEWELKLSILVRDKVLRQKLGQNARKTLEQYHSYDNVFESLQQALTH
ncbi:MAG: glycosyltransferase family 4 protein [Chitinophagales bacterium]